MANDWSQEEVEAIVDDYLSMLSSELVGENYNKAEHRRALLSKLNNRSHGSIEYKHQNISAVLIEMGVPYISGYKPMRNYQRAFLPKIVNLKISNNTELLNNIGKDVESLFDIPSVEDILNVLVSPPEYEQNIINPEVQEDVKTYGRSLRGSTNYIAREAANSKLGALGEEFAINYEKARLIYQGKNSLADKIDQVSISIGNRAGFDILSYDEDGTDRFIEVKTTKYGKETPFYITGNELKFSDSHKEKYQLYRIFSFRKNPRLFMLPGSVVSHCNLKPTQFMASF